VVSFALRIISVSLLAVLLGLSNTSFADSVAPASVIRVVCSTSIVEDLVRSVGGDRVQIVTLTPRGADHHTFEPSPAQVRDATEAKVFFYNGLGLDPWVPRFLDASGFGGMAVVVSKDVEPLDACDEHHDHDHDHHHHDTDPHAWMDVRNAIRYTQTIRDSLVAADAEYADAYRARADLAVAQLRALDGWIRRETARIPADRRLLVSDHDAFAYFAHAYGFETHTLRGVSTRVEPSAREAAQLIEWLRANEVRHVFLESGGNPRVLDRLAREAGARVSGRLHSGSLDEPGTPADTYIGMMRENVVLLTRTLGASED